MLNRSIRITFRVNAKEQKDLQKQVRKSGLSQENYIRTILSGRIPKATPPLDYYSLTRELNYIGRNLHQIAARANATGFILADEYDFNYKQLIQKVSAIEEAITMPEVVARGNDQDMEN